MESLFPFKKENQSTYEYLFNLVLSLYILSFGLETFIDIPLFGNRLLVPEFIFLCLAFIFFSNKKNWSTLTSFNKLDLWIIAYWVAVLIGFLYSQKNNALGELIGNTYLLGLYFILSKHYETYSFRPKALINTFVISGFLASVIAIIGYIFQFPSFIQLHENFYFLGDINRLHGLARGPIIFADYLSVVFILGTGLFLFNEKKETHYFVFLLVIAISIILSFSKSGLILAVAVIALFIFYYKKRIHRVIKFLLTSFCVFLTIFYLFFSHFFLFPKSSSLGQELASDKHASCESFDIPNTEYMLIPLPYYLTKKSAVIAFSRNFPFGVGGNELTKFSVELYEEGIFNCEFTLAPHSTIFGAIGELGLFGIITCSMLFILSFLQIKKHQTSNRKYYVIGMSVFIFIVLQSITTDMMNFRYLWILFFVVSFFWKKEIDSR